MRHQPEAASRVGGGDEITVVLVDDVQPQEGFSKHLSERIFRILGLEQSALRATKSMLVGVHDLESALAHERRHLKVAMSTPSYAHEIRSFVVDAVHGVSRPPTICQSSQVVAVPPRPLSICDRLLVQM